MINQNFIIHFGSEDDASFKYKDKSLNISIPIKKAFVIHPSLKLLRQIHSNAGFIVDKDLKPFSKEGDYLITNQKNVPIGVLTADCLSIIFFDPLNNLAAIAHAGWQGTTKKIAQNVIDQMTQMGSVAEDILVWMGPGAKSCCYEVDKYFYKNIPEHFQETLVKKGNQTFFDSPKFNEQLLVQSGVSQKNINIDNNFCTICNLKYCSYRRHGIETSLQLSYIMLK